MRDEGQKEYARTSDDVFANFNRISSYTGVPSDKVIMPYLMKHLDGINAYLNGHKSQREDVEGRIIDAQVYLFLLLGYITAEKEQEHVVYKKGQFKLVSSATPGVDFEDK